MVDANLMFDLRKTVFRSRMLVKVFDRKMNLTAPKCLK